MAHTEVAQALDALEAMEKLSGRTAKEKVLRQHKTNGALQRMVLMALGGEVYYVRPTANLLSASQMSIEEAWEKFQAMAAQLASRELTGDAASMAVDRFLASIPALAAKWFKCILTHDLRIGVSKKTITKVWGQTFWRKAEEAEQGWYFAGCCLAKKYEEVYKKKSPRFPVAVEPKLDGERALLFVFPAKNRIYIVSRSNKRKEHIEAVADFRDQVCSLARSLNNACHVKESKPVFLDGEFLAADATWNRTSSLVRSTKNFDRKAFLEEIRVVLFDWAWVDRYQTGEFAMPWKKRKAELLSVVEKGKLVLRYSPNLYVLNHRIVLDQDELLAVYESWVDQGFEGIMVKAMEAPHVFRRTDLLLKLKPEDDTTGVIVDMVPGKGKHAKATEDDLKKARAILKQWGPIKDDGFYLHCKTPHVKAAMADLNKVIRDAADRRISAHRKGRCSYRYSERLGYLVVRSGKSTFHVGGGFGYAAGQDQRMLFWQNREEMRGRHVDFRIQRDKKEVAVGRFNRFVRLREDLDK